MLDLDHVGPKHGQLIGRKRPRQHMRDVDHPDALERSRHRALLANAAASHACGELRQNWASRRSRLPRSSIFRPLNKLVGRNFGRIPLVHGLQTNNAFCNAAFALGKPRMRHRIKCSAVGTKEGLALGNWPCVRHGSASVDTGLLCASEGINSSNGSSDDPRESGGKPGQASDAGAASRMSLALIRGAAHVPLFAAGLVLGATVAILVAVCRWPSQRLAKGAGRSNWSSTRATMWLTMSSTVCGWL